MSNISCPDVQSAVSKNTSPANNQNESKRPSSTVPPVPLHNMPLFTILTSHCISCHGKLQLCTDASLQCSHKRLSIQFTARVGSDMNLADSSVVCCVSGLSCPTIQCCVKQRPALLRFSSVQDVCTVMQTFVHRFRTRCHKDAFCLLKLFLANETKLFSQSQCVYRIVNPEEVFSVPCHFFAHEFHCYQASRINTFTDSYPERFTHQLLKVVCSDT